MNGRFEDYFREGFGKTLKRIPIKINYYWINYGPKIATNYELSFQICSPVELINLNKHFWNIFLSWPCIILFRVWRNFDDSICNTEFFMKPECSKNEARTDYGISIVSYVFESCNKVFLTFYWKNYDWMNLRTEFSEHQ